MDAGDTGRLELVTNSAQEMERRLPYSVYCICGEKVTTENMQSVCCKCGILHQFRSIRTSS
jgi:hypothetical protein